MPSIRPTLLSVAIANILSASIAGAATLDVTTTDNAGAGSLRQIIVDAVSGDTIDLTGIAGGTISLDSELYINKNLHIYAPPTDAGEPSVTLTLTTPAAESAGGTRLIAMAPSVDPQLHVILQGLELTGGRIVGPGGAVYATDTALVVANSTISGNTAVSAGGGIAAQQSELCITATAVADNEVFAPDSGETSAVASGGGIAVVGTLEIIGSPKYNNEINECFDNDAGFFSEFADFEVVAGATRGASITGNKATADDSLLLDDSPYLLAALGGGVAVARGENSPQFDLGCDGIIGDSGELLCARGALIDGNVAQTLVGDEFDGERILTAMGGGVFVGRQFDGGGSISMKYSKVSGNTATIASNGSTGTVTGDTVMYATGGGVAFAQFDLAGLQDVTPPFFDDASFDGDKYSTMELAASVISGNSVDVSPPINVASTTSVLTGAGGGVSGYGSYGGGFGVFSFLSVVKENSIRTGEDLTSANAALMGGGVAAISGAAIRGPDSELGVFDPEIVLADTENFFISKYASSEDNTIIASPHLSTLAAGGGVASEFASIKYSKRAFDNLDTAYVDEVGGYFADIAAAQGSVIGNSLEIEAASDFTGVVGGGVATFQLESDGGGAPSGFKYASVNDNEVSLSGTGDTAFAAGGGIFGVSSGDVDESKYLSSMVSGNAITVSAAISSSADFYGAGLAVIGPRERFLTTSSLIGNEISISGTESPELRAFGGGVSAEDGVLRVENSTIANNRISRADGGNAYGAGLALDDVAESSFYHATIAGNTVVANVPSDRGAQLSLISSPLVDLENTLISGVDLAGAAGCFMDPFSVNSIDKVAISNAGNCTPDLDSSVADPQYLAPPAFNGGFGESKYFIELPTIALLTGSGAIDAASSGASNDQRGYPRDAQPDLGAFEFAADGDGDGVDGELGGAGTFPGTSGVPVLLPFGDGNSDGIPDSDQSTVTTLRSSSTSGGSLTLIGDGNDLENVQVSEISSLDFTEYYESVDALEPTPFTGAATASLGSISFESDSDGDFSLIVPASSGMDKLMKLECNPLQDGGPRWVVLDSTPEAYGAGGLRFEFTIEDDGRFDCLAGPGIRDPLVPVMLGSAAPVHVPTMAVWMQSLLASMLGLVGFFSLRRSKAVATRRS